jgi:hypothetical protein
MLNSVTVTCYIKSKGLMYPQTLKDFGIGGILDPLRDVSGLKFVAQHEIDYVTWIK